MNSGNNLNSSLNDLIYEGEDFFDQLTNEFSLPSLLDVDATPNEILEEASPFLVSLVSPTQSTLSPRTSSSNTTDSSSSEDDYKIYNSSGEVGLDGLITENFSEIIFEESNSNRDVQVDEFIIKRERVSPPRSSFNGPVVLIDNGQIKVEVANNETSNTAWKPFTVENENNCQIKVHSNTAQRQNGTKSINKCQGSNGKLLYASKSFPDTNSFDNRNINPLRAIRNGKLPIAALVTPNNGKQRKETKEQKPTSILLPKDQNMTNISLVNSTKSPNHNTKVTFMMIPTPPKQQPMNCRTQEESLHNNLQNGVNSLIQDKDVTSSEQMTEMQLRALKKHERMIKNRESACLSRKKKRDYVESLEQQLADAHREIGRLQMENTMLKEQLTDKGKIARKVPKLDPLSMIPRKNIAVLFAMVFMVSLNLTTLGGPWLTRNTAPKAGMHIETSGQRHLLWTENGNSEEEIISRVERATDPRLCGNITSNDMIYINETESVRLASELERWIGSNSFNLTLNDDWKTDVEGFANQFGLSDNFLKSYRLLNSLIFSKSDTQAPSKRITRNKRALKTQHRTARALRKNKADEEILDYGVVFPNKVRNTYKKDYMNIEDFGEWEALVRALHRRDDTFYVVGVGRGDHLLLPATAHNNTRPPKMALILPAKRNNDSLIQEEVMLMQIDCSVVNTSIVTLKANTMPKSYRHQNDQAQLKDVKTNHTVMNNNLNVSHSDLSGFPAKFDLKKRAPDYDKYFNVKNDELNMFVKAKRSSNLTKSLP